VSKPIEFIGHVVDFLPDITTPSEKRYPILPLHYASQASSLSTTSFISQSRLVTSAAMWAFDGHERNCNKENAALLRGYGFDFLWKRIRESRQSTRVHPNIQIVSLGEGCADYLGSGLLSIRCFIAPMHSAGL
jgi:hypothetical protein